MIGEILSDSYDVHGRRVSRLGTGRSRRFKSTAPMGRYVSHPLANQAEDLDEVREFLRTCTYVSDEEQFGRSDYWVPPEDFERERPSRKSRK